MYPINLYILDISSSESTSGVDRHIEKLLMGLKEYAFINVHHIQFLYNTSLIIYREEDNGHYRKTTFPLPQNYKEIIKEKYWMDKYNKHIFHLIKNIFKDKSNCILHLHTLNLIDLALLIKKEVDCKIITHLHCIPWKDYFNSSPIRFNELYENMYCSTKAKLPPSSFLTNNCEYDSYILADHIISGTQCGVDFLTDIMRVSANKISIANNGTNDTAQDYRKDYALDASLPIKCLFVANLSKSKGIEYVLDALRMVKKNGFEVILRVAGFTTPSITSSIKEAYYDLQIDILGVQTFEQLTDLYKQSELGIIASLQEQWSFVGVEMAMFGLPIITTAVDGLDEIFTDNEDALKVDTKFNNEIGLSVDTEMMANKIMMLIKNSELRAYIGKNARLLFEERLELQNMITQTVSVYQKLIKQHRYE